MSTPIIANLAGKAAAGAIAGMLIAGGAGAATFALASDEGELLETKLDGSTTDTTTKVDDDSTTDTTLGEDDTTEAASDRPETFGAVVSEDARDGGVDGQEIAGLARQRGDERRAEHGRRATRDHADEDEDEAATANDDDDTVTAGDRPADPGEQGRARAAQASGGRSGR